MPVDKQLAVLAANLEAYHGHVKALSEALEAIRIASDQILADVQKDRELVAKLADTSVEPGIEHSSDASLQIATEATTEHEIASTAIAHEPPTAAIEIPGIIPLASTYVPTVETTIALENLAAVTSATAKSSTAEPEFEQATPTVAEAVDTAATGIANAEIVDLAARRANSGSRTGTKAPKYRRAMTLAASLIITAGAVTLTQGLLQTEFGQRVLELGTCDGDMLSAQRDCALLAWLML